MPKEVRAATSFHRINPISYPAHTPSGSARGVAQWMPSDDETLMAARASGLNWQPIASKYFPNKTANACRKRHERLMERRNAEDWDGVKLETLATEYMNVRKEMWSLLADRVGEKWAIVEMKCMERGLKNIQAAYRAALRKERGNYEGDSGIGGSDAENGLDDNCSLDADVGEEHQAVHHHHHHHHHQSHVGFETMQRGGPSIQSMLSPEPVHASHV